MPTISNMVEGHAAEDDHEFQEGEMPEVALLGGRVSGSI